MVDRYTKIVLTIIAGALVWIAAALTGVPVAEATSPTPIAQRSPQAVNIVAVDGVPLNVSTGFSSQRLDGIPVRNAGGK